MRGHSYVGYAFRVVVFDFFDGGQFLPDASNQQKVHGGDLLAVEIWRDVRPYLRAAISDLFGRGYPMGRPVGLQESDPADAPRRLDREIS